ncbi:glutathione S-transferase family protein [Pleomorphomonas sp. PLEO]|uniref:glutathione S-transferase family protein n=1 Tax=Pleomorphomonas sp. PLEO TaxID=3239306 RepID=UPI00351F21B8
MKLLIANKGYSSWSQRAFLVLRHFGIPFEETVQPMFVDGWKEAILKLSPTGKVPCLVDGDITVWESLAIIEYLAEKFPDLGIWPADRAARAHARSASAEMHAGFQNLRRDYGSNWRRRYAWKVRGDGSALEDAKRIFALWKEARQRFGQGGPFLYGAFSAADAMYAPVVGRFTTYSWLVDAETEAYMEAVRTLPAYAEWVEAGRAEPWTIAHYEYDE